MLVRGWTEVGTMTVILSYPNPAPTPNAWRTDLCASQTVLRTSPRIRRCGSMSLPRECREWANATLWMACGPRAQTGRAASIATEAYLERCASPPTTTRVALRGVGVYQNRDVVRSPSRSSTNERLGFGILPQSWPQAMTDAERRLHALIVAVEAYRNRELPCRSCGRPLFRKPGPGRDPRWCSAACRARFRRRQATITPQAPQGAHVPR